ncbi:hypothetical protein V1512DRAFT_273575 [Lipomyces arxii]|uniref:uncharacterized protein n=1 Tax=Lipomyces arxii TaxID=56418 RepID=UPI0034CEEE1C
MSSLQNGDQQQPEFGSYIDFSELQLDLSTFDIDVNSNILGFEEFQKQQNDQNNQFQRLEHFEQLEQHHEQGQNAGTHEVTMFDDNLTQNKHLVADTVNRNVQIPPTPSSLDFVNGSATSNVFQSPSGMIDAFNMREEMMFTPLLSPAVTPLENPMAVNKEFTYPSAYFSPLTSPALEAQSYPFNNSTSPTGATGTANSGLRRSTTASYSGSAQSSPAQLPHGRLQNPRSPAQLVGKRRATAAFLNTAAVVSDASSSESISPEPLLPLVPENSMAPPPVPMTKSTSQSGSASSLRRLAPVTPASLMNLNKERVGHIPDLPAKGDADAIIEDVVRRSSTSAIQTATQRQLPRSLSNSEESTAPKAPGSANLRSLKPARSRSGSVSMSPTIKPRISPNLKPLLPDGMEAASALLAAKSNYQNIVEGKHSQLGLSYPEQLSINLTSKRTSHKIAEQGRRNRINGALSELNQLLVDNINLPVSDDEQDAKELPQQCSKANTVELAIDYIKKLHGRIEKLKGRLKESDAQLAVEKERNGLSEVTEGGETQQQVESETMQVDPSIDSTAESATGSKTEEANR